MKEYKIGNYDCRLHIPSDAASDRRVYMIYPALVPFPAGWLDTRAAQYGCNLAVVYVPAPLWNDSLTPWPEPGETRNAPPFGGEAPGFLKELNQHIVPEIEKDLGVAVVERMLLGVSLSGLFTLWQWMQCDTFTSIASLSGSFWYVGFMDWFDSMPVPRNKGKAFFLLGEKEPKTRIKAFRSVGENTLKIVGRLNQSGVSVRFEWVPGDHLSDSLGRAAIGLKALLEK